MTKEICYTSSIRIEEKIKNKHLIPYRVFPFTKYEKDKYYYSDYWGSYFRVIQSKYDRHNNLIDAYVKWEDGNYGLICTELDVYDLLFEKDYKELYKKDIINSDQSYTGAEIVYWFFINNINCFNKKYKGFWKFVDRSSSRRLADNTRYKLTADLKNDIFVNCKIIKIK